MRTALEREHLREHNAMLRRQGKLAPRAEPRPWRQYDRVNLSEIPAIRKRLKAEGWEVKTAGQIVYRRRPA